jgi:endonuclease/exonuclease/phosphatase family metal-dependent hydrolase
MRSHPKPRFQYTVDLAAEKRRLAALLKKPDRRIPAKSASNLLVATWNLTNFGLQQREAVHLQLMAEVLRRFDVVAVQEVADDLAHLEQLVAALGTRWEAIYTDIGGNDERAAVLYDTRRLRPTGLAAELAMRGYDLPRIEVEEVAAEAARTLGGGFNRNPFMVGFAAGNFRFTLVDVHLFWSNLGIRELETDALGRWAKNRSVKAFPPGGDIVLIGDWNMPHVRPGDRLYDIAKRHGVVFPKHTTDLVGTNLAGDSDYDEMAFFPGKTADDWTGAMGVLDFDNAVFPDLYQADHERFYEYVRYYVADHRPLWAEFKR